MKKLGAINAGYSRFVMVTNPWRSDSEQASPIEAAAPFQRRGKLYSYLFAYRGLPPSNRAGSISPKSKGLVKRRAIEEEISLGRHIPQRGLLKSEK